MKLCSPLLAWGDLRAVEPLSQTQFWPNVLWGIVTIEALPKCVSGLERIDVRGRLMPGQESLDRLPEILKNLIERHGSGAVRCGFEERGSKQGGSAYDSVLIEVLESESSFSYRANGSRVNTDPKYAHDFMARLIEVADLPVRIASTPTGYDLEPLREVGDLKSLRRSKLGLTGFRCRLSKAEILLFSESLPEAIRMLSSGKILACSWNASVRGRNSEERYELLCELPIPAEAYQLEFRIRLRGLDDLETARRQVGKGTVAVGRLETGTSGGEALIEVHVSGDGFRLVVDTRRQSDIPSLEQRLGVKFRPKV